MTQTPAMPADPAQILYKVVIIKGGPYLVTGNLALLVERVVFDENEIPLAYETVKAYDTRPTYALCRCGKSAQMPFCDGSHQKYEVDLTETATREQVLERAHIFAGRDLILYDIRDLCIGIGFCHRSHSTWILTRKSDNPDYKALAIETARLCPSGRLIAAEKNSQQQYELVCEPHISLIEDLRQPFHRPVWLKGGIPLQSSDGFIYEIRQRVTLCSCGKSRNKPFCDGRHYFA